MTTSPPDWRTELQWWPDRVANAERVLADDIDDVFAFNAIEPGTRIRGQAVSEIAEALRSYACTCSPNDAEDMWPVAITTTVRYMAWTSGLRHEDAVRHIAEADSPQPWLNDGEQIDASWDTEPADPADMEPPRQGPINLCPLCRHTPPWGSGWIGVRHTPGCTGEQQ